MFSYLSCLYDKMFIIRANLDHSVDDMLPVPPMFDREQSNLNQRPGNSVEALPRRISMPTLLIGRISWWGLGIACIIGLAACGAADQPAGAPSSPAAPQAAVVSVEPSPAAPAMRTPIPAAPATQLPTATPKEAIVPNQKPTQPPTQPPTPARPTFQLGATLAPEGLAPANTPIGAAPAAATAQTAPVEAAKADLARRRSVAPDTFRIVEVRDVIWADRGLGCPQPGMAYNQVQVDGLLIRLESGGQIFEYHSGGSKAPFLCEQPSGRDQVTPAL